MRTSGGIRVLLTDDETTFRTVLRRELERKGHEVQEAASGKAALDAVRRANFDVILLDLNMPQMDGIEMLRHFREESLQGQVIVLTGRGSIATAVEAVRLGAYDYLTKPCSLDELDAILRRAAERAELDRENTLLKKEVAPAAQPMLGESRAIRAVQALAAKVARAEAPVLITGESGTGKELVAREIHRLSPRGARPLVTVNCASLRDSLLESELFGHEKGAFTGASRVRPGLFEMADRNTLFLDEIGDMNLEIQAKVLRAVQDGETRRLGSDHPRHVDVRIVAATNKNLPEASRAGAFREDLYYRLATVEVHVPPLRERAEDIPELAKHFLQHTAVTGRQALRFSPSALRVLQRHPWPGNVRELKNIVERIAILGEAEVIDEPAVRIHLHGGIAGGGPGWGGGFGVEGIAGAGAGAGPAEERLAGGGGHRTPNGVRGTGAGAALDAAAVAGGPAGRGETLDDAERAHIARILALSGGNKREAARRLGVSLRTLYNKIHKHPI